MQPPPIKTDTPAVWPLILADLRAGALVEQRGDLRALFISACEGRHRFGLEKYGTALQVLNGRNPLSDALDEALDLMAYTRQYLEQVGVGFAPHQARASRLHVRACEMAVLVLAEMERS